MEELCRAAVMASDIPVTLKLRAGVGKHEYTSLKLFPSFQKYDLMFLFLFWCDLKSYVFFLFFFFLYRWGLSAVTLHGRTQQQRYTKRAGMIDNQERLSFSFSLYLFIKKGV